MSSDHTGIISDLKARKKKIDSEINGLEKEKAEIDMTIKTLTKLYGAPCVEPDASVLHQITPGTLSNLTLADAAQQILSRFGTEIPNAELWRHLSVGGIKTTSGNPVNNMNSILNSKPGIFKRGPHGGWMLWPDKELEKMM